MWLLLSLSALAAPTLIPQASGGVLIRPGGATVPASTLQQPPAPLVSSAAPISMDLQDADIHSVLRLVAATAGVNIVASDGVQGKITVRLEDVPWDQALSAILATHNLVAVTYGPNLLVVEPIAAATAR